MSFGAMNLCGNARELGSDLSNHADCGIALRSSLELTRQLTGMPKSNKVRAITFSINKLATFGIFLRDLREPLISTFMEKTLLAMREATGLLNPMGNLNFQGAGHCGTTLGTGDKGLIKYAIHGTYHQFLNDSSRKY